MGRLRFPVKFALIACAFVLPLAVVGYFFLREINGGIAFALNERQGVEYDRPLTKALFAMVEHQRAASQGQATGEAASKVEQALEETQKADKKLGQDLKSTEGLKAVQDAWPNAKQTKTWDEAQKAHGELVTATAALVTTIGNNSQLILDPDLDSYYLMDTTIIQLPSAIQKMALARDLASKIAKSGQITADNRSDLTVLISQFRTPVGNFSADLDQAVAFNPSVKDGLAPGQKASAEACEAFAVALEKGFIKAEKPGMTPAQVDASATQAFEAMQSYHGIAAEGLDKLLVIRADGLFFRRAAVSATVVFSFVLALYLYLGFYKSTVSSVRSLVATARAIAAGDFEQQINLNTKDEVGELAADLTAMTQGLRQVAQAAERIADGDLDVDFAARGENDALGKSLERMLTNLNALMHDVIDSAHVVEHMSHELHDVAGNSRAAIESITESVETVKCASQESAMASQAMAKDCESQTISAERANTAMANLKEAVAGVASDVSRQLEHTEQAAKIARESDKTVRSTVESIARISEQVEASATHVKSLGARGEQIGSIVQTISQIAEQTNLLALNAAIEAARAGDHGKGFAVVADEVRKLAERSENATKEIGQLIEAVRSDVDQALYAMELSHEEVNSGTERSSEALTSLELMLETTMSVSHDAEEVTHTATAMSGDTDAVLDAISTVTAVSQSTSAGAEELTATAEGVSESVQVVARSIKEQERLIDQVATTAQALHARSQSLNDTVSRFKTRAVVQEASHKKAA